MRFLRRILFLFLPFLSFLSASCSSVDEPTPSSRSLLIYMVAENDMTDDVEDDLRELERGTVPAYFDSGEMGDVLLVYMNRKNEPPRLYRFSRENKDINREIVREYEEHNSCDPEVMGNILSYAANLFPAQTNGLIFWSHGSGWLPDGFYQNPYSFSEDGIKLLSEPAEDPYAGLVRSFAPQDGYPDMDIKDLADALPIRYSFILFDACLMGGIEVAYELKDKTDYFIASPTEIMMGGYPYDKVSEYYFQEGLAGLPKICRAFRNHYHETGDGATVAMIRTDALTDLAEACLNIFESRRLLIPSLNMSELQGYYRMERHYFYDLRDFVSRIASESQLQHFDEALDKAVVCRYATSHFLYIPIRNFSGLSTYVPNPKNRILDTYYKDFEWNRATRMIQ